MDLLKAQQIARDFLGEEFFDENNRRQTAEHSAFNYEQVSGERDDYFRRLVASIEPHLVDTRKIAEELYDNIPSLRAMVNAIEAHNSHLGLSIETTNEQVDRLKYEIINRLVVIIDSV